MSGEGRATRPTEPQSLPFVSPPPQPLTVTAAAGAAAVVGGVDGEG